VRADFVGVFWTDVRNARAMRGIVSCRVKPGRRHPETDAGWMRLYDVSDDRIADRAHPIQRLKH